jgi:glycosyltransferase involved in cell wall biosynthesis
MRVLQLTPYYAPAWAYGGPPRVMTDFASGLAARGHTVTVLTTDVLDETHRAAPRTEVMAGVRVTRYPNLSNSLAWGSKKYLPPGFLPAVLRQAGRHDVIHVTDTRTFVTASSFLGSLARSVPLCLSAHGSLPASPGLRGAVKSVYDTALVRPMLRRSPLLLAQTDHEARLYASSGGRESAIRLLPLPLPPIALGEPAGSGGFRELVGIDASARLLLFLGRVNRLKGLDILIEAVQPLLCDDVVLAVVGRDDGQLDEITSRFESLFADGRARFVGPLYGDDRFQAYAEADVFCLTPPHWEETSVAALEAAACGTAVVVTEQADIPGLAASGGGFVVPLAREEIRAAVAAALARSDEMGRLAQAHVKAQHGRDAVVTRLEGYLEAVVGSAS